MAALDRLSVTSLFDTKGWTAVVTGGGTGLGLITAQALAANGMKVYVTGRRIEKLKSAETTHSASGGSIVALQMDVCSKDSIRAGVAEIAKNEKCINFLVNNAGVTFEGPRYSGGIPEGSVEDVSKQLFEDQGFEEWDRIYRTNVSTCYFVSAAFLPLLAAAKTKGGFSESGSILNVSSISGITKESQYGQFAYNASKAATISLTEQLAVDFKRHDLEIRVNTIAPGYFPSEMTPIAKEEGEVKEHFRNKWGIPFGRAGRPEDYAQAVINFAVNGYVTGATLTIDGGWLLAHA
ncbi:NAD(P)-binding protein [Polychaeton citri CBS 116435]|uniref:NAD(P)-binding protein n=1 Tax=Polychaeton citri CBS 116435 TaxID=1314669 RepID=A0A9P4URU2_9PEZI|nr:NAD(P)-binding protein [Polychaeton citri CBS 116435]